MPAARASADRLPMMHLSHRRASADVVAFIELQASPSAAACAILLFPFP
jgi:hypothetical protein